MASPNHNPSNAEQALHAPNVKGPSGQVAELAAGARAVLPILLGVFPFGMIYGASSMAAGFSTASAVGLSLIAFAGAAQLAAVELIAHDASPVVIVLTAWVINLRFVMYSASLADWFRSAARRHQLLMSYLLTDQAYAVSLVRFEARRDCHRMAFYLGAALTLWGTWQTATLTGIALGSGLPPALELDFAIPLTFIALMVPILTDRPRLLAAVVAGLVAVAGRQLPYNLGLLVATASGIAVGLMIDGRQQPAVDNADHATSPLASAGPRPCPEGES